MQISQTIDIRIDFQIFVRGMDGWSVVQGDAGCTRRCVQFGVCVCVLTRAQWAEFNRFIFK